MVLSLVVSDLQQRLAGGESSSGFPAEKSLAILWIGGLQFALVNLRNEIPAVATFCDCNAAVQAEHSRNCYTLSDCNRQCLA